MEIVLAPTRHDAEMRAAQRHGILIRVLGAAAGVGVASSLSWLVLPRFDHDAVRVAGFVLWPIVVALVYTVVVDGPRSLRGLVRR